MKNRIRITIPLFVGRMDKEKELSRRAYLGVASLFAVFSCLLLTGCSIDDEKPPGRPCHADCELALRLTASHDNLSRTADAVTQNNGTFRGIQDMWLLPFDVNTPVATSKPLAVFDTESIENSELLTQSKAHLFRELQVPINTHSFVVYGRAREVLSGVASERENEKFHYGVLADNLSAAVSEANEISLCEFSLQPIATQEEAVGARLAEYLSIIAQTNGWSASTGAMRTLYNDMTTMRAGASRNVKAMVQGLYKNLYENLKTSEKYDEQLERAVIANILTTGYANDDDDDGQLTFDSSLDGYPANRNLPDGAALLSFDAITKTFTAQQGAIANGTFTDAVYAYPAALYYRVSSGVLVSENEQQPYYNGTNTWETILSRYHEGSVQVDTRSVAISQPLQYSVAQLQLSLKLSSQSLTDCSDAYFDTGSGLPVRAVLVGGQMPVDWAFHGTAPDATVMTIYDKEVSTTATVSGSAAVSTLVLETYPREPVYVCVEMENTSTCDFRGYDGIVAAGCKFYLVGQLDASGESYSSHGYRVFTQDMTTRVDFTITDLKRAYVCIPDLRSPQLQLGLTANLNWQSGISKDKTI